MKKIMNFRPLVLFAMSLILGVVLATFVFVSENLKLVFLIMFLLTLVCSIILIVIFKAKFLKYLAVSIALIVFAVGYMFGVQHKINNLAKYNETEVVISGRICSNYKFTDSGKLGFLIDNVCVIDENGRKEIDGKIQVYVSPDNFDLSSLKIGKYISSLSTLYVNDLTDKSGYALSAISNKVYASGFLEYQSFKFDDKFKISIDERVRQSVYNKLKSYDLNYADVGYGMLFGDSNMVDKDVVSAFRTTGIAHILAVSGLHVSILAMLVSFVLKLLKCSNKTNVILMAIILLLYCYLCDFSVSVVRASLMTIMFLYFKLKGKCYDRLSVLALSACLILIVCPIKLFNISFVLSFMAVLAITLLFDVFEWLFDKCFHKKLSGSLALIFAVQVGLVFVQLYFFKNYTPLSIVCNFISIPVSILAFDLLIIGLLISVIFPFMSFLMGGFDYLIGLVVKFNYTISKVGFAISATSLSFLIVIFGIAIMLLLSNFVFIKKRYKAVGVSLFMVLSTILMLLW